MVSAILAGGKNSRLPFAKCFLQVGGRKLIERNLELLGEITGKVVISTNEPELYFHMGVPLVGDVVEPSGPMSGILSVLQATGAPEVFVTACDMPFISGELVRYIIGRRAREATVPVFNGRPEPLLAVYTRAAAGAMEALLARGRRALSGLLQELDVAYVEEEEVRKIDPEGRSFININTLGDLERAFSGGRTCLD
ncbi:MAG: molybdenum cofactor guanylyltransferase [Thermodesulfovibrionales bacterium]